MARCQELIWKLGHTTTIIPQLQTGVCLQHKRTPQEIIEWSLRQLFLVHIWHHLVLFLLSSLVTTFFIFSPSPTFVPLFLSVLLLQEGRVGVGGGGARLCRYISPPAGSLQSQHCGGYSRRLLHPKWPCPFFHPSNGQETDTIADLLPILYTLWDAFLPPATSAAAPPPTRWVEERRGPDQLSQCPAAGSGPASACKHFKLS